MIPAVRRQVQEDFCEFEASLVYIVRPISIKANNKTGVYS